MPLNGLRARDTLMQLVQVSPEVRERAMDKVFESFDFEGADEIAKRLTPPDPNNPPPPTAEQQLAMVEAQADTAKAEATMATAQATMKTAEAAIAAAAAKEAQAKYDFATIGMDDEKDYDDILQ